MAILSSTSVCGAFVDALKAIQDIIQCRIYTTGKVAS